MHVYGVQFFAKNSLPDNITLEQLRKEILEYLPQELFRGVNSVFLGDFKYLHSRGAQAISYNNSIFISSQQETTKEIIDDLAHELGHSVEKRFFNNIHNNPTLKSEFLAKKNRAIGHLRNSGLIDYDYEATVEHDPALDDLLANEIGLHNLEKTFANLIVTPYSLISLSEYFSEGLEFYLLNDAFYLQNICPVLYNVIVTILKSGE